MAKVVKSTLLYFGFSNSNRKSPQKVSCINRLILFIEKDKPRFNERQELPVLSAQG